MGLKLDEFYSMTIGNYNRVCIGYIRRDERKWLHDRQLLALLVNINRKKNSNVIRPENIIKTSFDTISNVVINKEDIEHAKKVWKING